MTNCQILRGSFQRTPLHILKWYHLRRAIKSTTLSILFLHSCTFSPRWGVRQAFFMSEKASYHFFLQSRTDHRLGHTSWQPITKLHWTSLATEQTIWWTATGEGVGYPKILAWIYEPWCFWGLTKTAFNDTLGWQIMSMYSNTAYYLTDQ